MILKQLKTNKHGIMRISQNDTMVYKFEDCKISNYGNYNAKSEGREFYAPLDARYRIMILKPEFKDKQLKEYREFFLGDVLDVISISNTHLLPFNIEIMV